MTAITDLLVRASEKMQEIANLNDEEIGHSLADKLLCDLIGVLAAEVGDYDDIKTAGEIIRLFNDMGKWYA